MHGEVDTPTSHQPPRINQGRMLLGPAALRTCPLASPRSQVRARLGPEGYYRHSRNGGPQTYLHAAHGVALQAGPSVRSVLVSSLVLKRQVQARSPEASGKGFHISKKTKTSRTARRRSPWSPGRRHHQSIWQAKTTFVRITCTSCLPSNWTLWDPFPLNIWEEDQGLYK